ncbi:MAG TPA: hypothetical protein PK605_13100 [Ignavibacteria bacterium]|nr:hypothetical protein [Bacteroidota bacterium]HRE11076.1 hypothetical protein [Ignavibacteria bacterium]HRF64935.1 hypothetical protein [Ignavibacteria bacterium]HRJ05332.1 hypothetical protein [Ignavibacteria bacterium]HRJ85365.1 hypothetical protein [Ignavibacteria bacterium]
MIEVLIIVGVFAAIIGFFMYASKSGAKMLAEREARIARASRGKAVVIGSHPVGIRGTGHGGHYQGYGFTLDISDGFNEPYRAHCVWEVYPMGAPKAQPGMEINVKIDTEDNQIIFPLADGLAFSWNYQMMHKKNKKEFLKEGTVR